MSFDFNDKVVLITGSSQGIGAQTAIQMAKCGAKVVVTGRNQQLVSQVAQQCQQISPNGFKALEVVADMNNKDDLKRLVDSTIEEFGRLDVLVNNAALFRPSYIGDNDFSELFESMIQLNLISVVRLTNLCVEHLAKTKGNVVNVSSVASIMSVKFYRQFVLFFLSFAPILIRSVIYPMIGELILSVLDVEERYRYVHEVRGQ